MLDLVGEGPASGGATVGLTAEQLDDLVTDRATFMGFFTHGTLDQTSGRLEDLLDWWLVLRAALDDRAIHTNDPMEFRDLDGAPLDLFTGEAQEKTHRLVEGLDQVRDRYGHAVVVSGRSLSLLGTLPQDRYGFVLRTPSLTK